MTSQQSTKTPSQRPLPTSHLMHTASSNVDAAEPMLCPLGPPRGAAAAPSAKCTSATCRGRECERGGRECERGRERV